MSTAITPNDAPDMQSLLKALASLALRSKWTWAAAIVGCGLFYGSIESKHRIILSLSFYDTMLAETSIIAGCQYVLVWSVINERVSQRKSIR